MANVTKINLDGTAYDIARARGGAPTGGPQ